MKREKKVANRSSYQDSDLGKVIIRKRGVVIHEIVMGKKGNISTGWNVSELFSKSYIVKSDI